MQRSPLVQCKCLVVLKFISKMCTNFSLNSKNPESYISARTMDFAIELHTKVKIVSKNQDFRQTPLLISKGENDLLNEEELLDVNDLQNPEVHKQKLLKWKNKYGYVGMSCGASKIRSIPDGMNEKGLSVGALWLAGSKYPSYKSATKPVLLNVNFPEWVLGNFDSVESVKSTLESVTIVNISDLLPEKIKNLIPALRIALHFIISDAFGKSLIVEFTNGEMQFYESDDALMTNAPPYPYHLDNVKNYINLTLRNAKQGDLEVNGSGCVGLPGDYTSVSRFVRIYMLMKSLENFKPEKEQEKVGLAARILQNVALPKGSVIKADKDLFGKDPLDYTQWGVVRDQTNLVYYFFTQFNNNLFSIDLNKIDFEKTSAKPFSIKQSHWVTDLTPNIESA